MACLIALLCLLLSACGGEVVPAAAPPQGNIHIEDGATAVVVRSAAASVRIDKRTAALALADGGGSGLTQSAAAPTFDVGGTTKVLQRVRGVRVLTRDGATSGVELTGDAGDLTVLWRVEFLSPRAIAARLRPSNPSAVTGVATTLRAAPDEHFYGLTERIVDDRAAGEIAPRAVGALDRRGEMVSMMVTPTVGLYTPFFHSSRGYGVFVEGTMPGSYDMAHSDPNVVRVDFQFNPRTGEHGVVYLVGDYDTLLDEYTRLTGRPFVPPRWGFLHLRWRDEHRIATPALLDGVEMNADFVNDISMYEALGIPAGNYEFDRPWTDGVSERGYPGFASFRFDPVRFPNTDAMLAALQRRGYHVLVWVGPWALGENAPDAERFGYYAPRTQILIDFTNPAAGTWWTGKVQSLVEQGIAGLKLDRSEFALSEIGDAVPDRPTDVFADGRNGVELKNGYTLDFARVHYDAFAARRGTDFFNYLRAGYAGSQQYGIFEGGDTTGRNAFGTGLPTDLGLRSAILSLARVAFMGFPLWGTDTGGYYQFGQRDVFARWLEFSALCPLMEIGGGNQGGGQHAPWDMPTQPADDAEMIDIYRRYVTLHHELVPLLYSLALGAHASGRPVARPLVFDFPGDPMVADLWDEFLLGHDLLVAPLWQNGSRSRSVYLPEGTWIDYWDPSQRIDGPLTVTADAPLDRLPLYVRAGGILPLEVNSSVTGNGSAASAGRLTIDGYPSGASSLTLHEAEGQTVFTLLETQCAGASCVRLQIGRSSSDGLQDKERGFIVRLLTEAPTRVTLDGRVIPGADSFAAWELVQTGWFYDPATGRLWAKFSSADAAVTVEAVR